VCAPLAPRRSRGAQTPGALRRWQSFQRFCRRSDSCRPSSRGPSAAFEPRHAGCRNAMRADESEVTNVVDGPRLLRRRQVDGRIIIRGASDGHRLVRRQDNRQTPSLPDLAFGTAHGAQRHDVKGAVGSASTSGLPARLRVEQAVRYAADGVSAMGDCVIARWGPVPASDGAARLKASSSARIGTWGSQRQSQPGTR
jgi:hypothetical protein